MIQQFGLKSPQEAWNMCVLWNLNMDPPTIEVRKQKDLERKKLQEEAKKKRAVERAQKKATEAAEKAAKLQEIIA